MEYSIDPKNITNFNRTDIELQTFWLFCVLVAGKNSRVQALKLKQFLFVASILKLTPFHYIELCSRAINGDKLDFELREVKLGQYTRIKRCFAESLLLDLRKCTVDDLEAIFGVGPKTARFFLLHSRKDQRLAVLDTHVLKWMSDTLGISVPRVTPNDRVRYHSLENQYLAYCDTHGLLPSKLDLEIWTWYNNARFDRKAA